MTEKAVRWAMLTLLFLFSLGQARD